MSNTAPSRSLSCLLLLAGPLSAPAFAQSNVRPAPVLHRAPRAAGAGDVGSKAAEEASYLTLASSAPLLPPDEPAAPAWGVELDLGVELLPAADLESGGERSMQRASWAARLSRAHRGREFAVFVDSEARFYDWSSPVPLASGSADPFNDLYRTSLGTLWSFGVDDPIGWFAGAEVNLHGEDDASLSDAVSLGAIAGVDVHASPDLRLSFGLAALTRIEDSTFVLPYFGFDWRATERLRFATEGARVLAEAELSDAWTATLAAEYELSQFRLNEDGPIPSGVFQDDRITLSGGLAWRFSAHAALELEAGVVAWQESTFLDADGDELGEVETDPAPFGALRLRIGI